jgi:hypothetical protein
MTCIADPLLGFWQRCRLSNIRDDYIRWVSRENNVRWAEGREYLTREEKEAYISNAYIHRNDKWSKWLSDPEIRMEYSEFRAYVCGPLDIDNSPYVRGGRLRGCVDCPYRDGDSYRKSHDHKKKSLTEKEKNTRAWREYKGIDKDKSKSGRWYRDTHKWWTKRSAQEHRAWVRQNLTRGNYDAFWNGEYKIFIDPWKYD